MELGTSELTGLVRLSASVGSNPLLVQGATGNTSMKLDGVLWIKASGKWLAHAAKEEIFIPLNLSDTRRLIEEGINPSGQTALVDGRILGSSVETAMHAVLPHRVVIHVHSINTITWSILEHGETELAARLEGLRWSWVAYCASGLALATAVSGALRRSPGSLVLVLANHGLVVCGESTAAAAALLDEVERRIAIAPRPGPQPRWDRLNRLAQNGKWWVPQCSVSHFPALDETARRVLSAGVLFPCQAIFLTTQTRVLPEDVTPAVLQQAASEPFVLIENVGVLLGERSNPTEAATFGGLVQILARLPEAARVRYLSEDDIRSLLTADCYRYRELAEGFGRLPFVPDVDASPVGIMASKLA